MVWSIIVGGFIGFVAGVITRKGGSMGILSNVVAGLIGSFVGQRLFGTWGPALAGAQALNDPLAAAGAQPCQQAGRVASDNQASLNQCLIEGQDLIVRVSRTLNLGPWQLVANAAAKAGPDPNQQP